MFSDIPHTSQWRLTAEHLKLQVALPQTARRVPYRGKTSTPEASPRLCALQQNQNDKMIAHTQHLVSIHSDLCETNI